MTFEFLEAVVTIGVLGIVVIVVVFLWDYLFSLALERRKDLLKDDSDRG